jgi:hypothetical protein
MIKKELTLLIFLVFFFPQNWARATIDVDEVLSTRRCGDFKFLSESVEESVSPGRESYACRLDDGVNDKRHLTIGAMTQLHVSHELLETSKDVADVVDKVLLDLVREKIKTKFDQKLKELHLTPDDPFEKAYRTMQIKILDDGKSAKSQVRKLLVLFPDIEDQILKDNPEYKALICRHEVWKKNRKILRAVALGFTLVELSAILVAAPLTATIILTANLDRALLLSQILMVGGTAGVIGGALQIGNSISNWNSVDAAKNAKMFLKFYRGIEEEIRKLKKNPDENRDRILELQKWLPTAPELEQLKLTKKKQFNEYKNLFWGLTKFGAGIVMIYGGDQLLKMILEFQSESVTDPTTGSISPPWMD